MLGEYMRKENGGRLQTLGLFVVGVGVLLYTYIIIYISAENTLLVCLFNARSVGTSRRSDISTFIQDNNIDIMLLTKTWLCPASDEAKIADLALPGYSVLSFPRSAGGSGAKGGGIAFVIRDSLKPHVATTSSFDVQHPCFETAQLTLRYNKQLTTLFCIYNNISIMLLMETWLCPAGDEAKIADLAPPGYSVFSFPRSAGGSGAKQQLQKTTHHRYV